MRVFQKITTAAVLGISAYLTFAGGCCWPEKTPTAPLGTQSDAIWRRQEAGASASDFVIYQHEFVTDPDNKGPIRLNAAGEDHLKSIAARLHCGAPLPVVVERSTMSVDPNSQQKYPVNPNPALDMQRRELVVKSLVALGIGNAEQCVVVAPALAEGYTATEAAQAYANGVNNVGAGYKGYGGTTSGGLGGIGVGGTL